MEKYRLKYGSDRIEFNIDDSSKLLSVIEPSEKVDREDFERSLDNLLDLKPGNSVSIVVSDKTRLCGYELFLPWLTENLESRGILKDNITFYIAYGTHPSQSDEESYKAYGETFHNYRFIHHDCDDIAKMKSFGKSSSGTEMLVRSDVFDKDFLILFGAISHHYFAGYGGGRKLIFPGLAARESIYHNHKLFIDFDAGKLHPGCQSGKLAGNPVAEDLKEIDDMIPEKLIISGILNTNAQVAQINFNRSYKEFQKTCAIYDNSYRYQSDEKFDLVIASAGGYPKDINFIQTHKSMHNAASFVKDGGKLILLGECRDGIGNKAFINIFSGTQEVIIQNLKSDYSGNGGTALSTLSKTSRIEVMMHTNLSDSDCKLMGVQKISIRQLHKVVDAFNGKVAIIENASIIF